VPAFFAAASRIVVCVSSALMLSCDAGVDTLNSSTTFVVWRFGDERVAFMEVRGNYDYPGKHPALMATDCVLSVGQEEPVEFGLMERTVWDEFIQLEGTLDASAALDSVDCPSFGAVAEDWTGTYFTINYEGWDATCFVRSDENRPETNAFLDLLDRVIDESIDCPGS
jgi:hypothetical protein